MLREAEDQTSFGDDPRGSTVVNVDSAREFTSTEFLNGLQDMGIAYRLQEPGRAQRKALASVDVATEKLSELLFRYARESDTDAWFPYLGDALEE